MPSSTTILPQVELLASAFSAVLREWLGVAGLAEVDQTNISKGYILDNLLCACHDKCDANMAMDAAFRNAFGRGVKMDSDSDLSLWNEAWMVAKQAHFYRHLRELGLEAQLRTAKAKILFQVLGAINITEVPVVSLDRNIERKEQAKLARELFSKLGIKGISVTAPSYSMASSVHVSFPRRNDYSAAPMEDLLNDPAHQANNAAHDRIEAILLAAFPNSDDRSDTQSDHFDFRWSIQ